MKKASYQQWHYFQLTLQLFQRLTFFKTTTSLVPIHLQQRRIDIVKNQIKMFYCYIGAEMCFTGSTIEYLTYFTYDKDTQTARDIKIHL